MQKNYFQNSHEDLGVNINKTPPMTGNFYTNYLKNQQQTKSPVKLNQKTKNLKQFLENQRNADQKDISPSPFQNQDLIEEDIQPQNRNSLSSRVHTSNQPIERLSINFQQQFIEKQKILQTNDHRKNLDELPLKYRMRIAVKSFKYLKQCIKRQKYRRSVVNELVTTEKQYFIDLKLMLSVQSELKQKSQLSDRIIGSTDIKSLFQNLDAILGLSEQMLEQLIVIQQNFDGETKIGNHLKQFASFFKFYFEYCNNYSQGQKMYITWKKENMKFKAYISNLEKHQLKGASFENYLIKPVQRVPKYVLLLKDLLKNTLNTHNDYKDIQQALEQFIKVNDENNKNMDKQITNQKIFELQKQFGTSELMIVDAKREFKSEESLKVYFNNEPRSVIVYFLNDLILVTEREDVQQKVSYKLIKYIFIDQHCLAQEQEDTAYISFLFRLIGKNETVTFIADNSENQQKFINYLNELIAEQKKNQGTRQQVLERLQVKVERPIQAKYPVVVKVLGTQEVYESNVKTFTQYIISVEIANIIQKIFIRFSNFLQIQKDIQSKFPKLKLPYFNDNNWMKNHDVQVIEGRGIQIMNFLQTLLTTEQIVKEGQQILKLLELPLNFYSLPELLETQTQNLTNSMCSSQHNYTKKPLQGRNSSVYQTYFINDQLRTSNERNSSQEGRSGIKSPPQVAMPQFSIDFLKDLDQQFQDKIQKTGDKNQQIVPEIVNVVPVSFAQRANSQQNTKFSASKLVRGSLPINESMMSSSSQKQLQKQIVKIQVQLLTFPQITNVEIFICPETKGNDVFEDVFSQSDLQTAFDFKLYIEEKKGQRPIEEDELIWNLLVEKQNEIQSTAQRLTSLVKKVTSYIYNYNQKPLIFKKHLYLPEEIERDNYEDVKRVELIAQQTFMEITNHQLKLNNTEYTMFTALWLYLGGINQINQNEIPMAKIQQFLPLNVFKSISQDNWLYLLPDMLKNFEDDVQTIIKENNPDDKQQLIQFDENDKEKDRLSIGQLVFLKLISLTQFYGLKIFELTSDNETRANIQKICQDQFRAFIQTLNKSAQNQSIPTVSGLKFLLCVGYNCISVYSDYQQTRPLIRLEYAKINQVKAHPLSLKIQLQPEMAGTSFQISKTITLHFETSQSFVIQMLFQEYQEVRQTFEEYNEQS